MTKILLQYFIDCIDRLHIFVNKRFLFYSILMQNHDCYASPDWASFANAADIARLEAFLKQSISFGYRSASSPNFARTTDEVDNKLFKNILSNASHLLHALLPPLRDSHYNLRDRSHPHQLPTRTTALRDCNFIIRMLYKKAGSSTAH